MNDASYNDSLGRELLRFILYNFLKWKFCRRLKKNLRDAFRTQKSEIFICYLDFPHPFIAMTSEILQIQIRLTYLTFSYGE